MRGTNLAREEARDRAALVDVQSYDVRLDWSGAPDPQAATYQSETVVLFTARTPGASTFIDLVAPNVRAITLNGREVDPAEAFQDSRIALTELREHNELRVVADCAYMNTGEGLHRMIDPVDGEAYLYTQFGAPESRRAFPVFEQPDLKATFAFTIQAPESWLLFSNSPTPAPESRGDGTAVWAFEPTPRISSYITALVGGKYHVARSEHTTKRGQKIPLAVGVRASLAEYLRPEEIFEITKQGFDFYTEKFDRDYPFAKYDQLFVPEFNFGAMENAGCVTFREEMIFRSKVTDAAYEQRGYVILHEMAHMWFGDLVTMQWWNDLWLNESFATFTSFYAQVAATRFKDAWTTFANRDKSWGYRQDQLPSTHPIVAEIRDLEDVMVNLDGITYAKGASVLKQLAAWVGDDHFFEGVRRYFTRHAWGNTTLADLLSALEETSGRDLKEWSKLWLETAGPNTLRPVYEVDDAGRFTSFAVEQEGFSEQFPTLRPHRLAIGLYNMVDGALVRTDRVELDVTGASTEVADLIGKARPALVLLNDDDLTYAKIRLDEHSMATLVDHVGDFAESLPRTLCWSAAWDMLRNAELAARDYLTLVLRGIGRESDIGVSQLLQRQAKSSVELFADPAWRPTGQALLADACWEHLNAVEPGSDFQLAWARSLAENATTDDQLSSIAGLLDGSIVLEGLSIDTELRWTLLTALVVGGKADVPQIEAELARDKTATGERYALQARAARPTAAAKAEAWASVVDSDTLANRTVASVIAGFQAVPADKREELLKPYAAKYFTAVEGTWESRTHEIAAQIASGLYPSFVVEQATLDATDAWLADRQPVPALRRLMLEAADTVARCLKAQEKDRAAGY
ncbi:aminopeptidase N [Catenulispora acidiphila]|uniref:aminopeptidase N n=1 Tax=Catenulispora acidiphila TaxID=304895 RepID=UPI0005A00901|nr:aminopeptidase N [Catenulispora acidiphila]